MSGEYSLMKVKTKEIRRDYSLLHRRLVGHVKRAVLSYLLLVDILLLSLLDSVLR